MNLNKKEEGKLEQIPDSEQVVIKIDNEVPKKLDKIEKDDKKSFEDFKNLYKGVIDMKCNQDYGTVEDKDLWEDCAKELFLKSKTYLLKGNEYKAEPIQKKTENKKVESVKEYNTIPEIKERLKEINKQLSYIKRRDAVSLSIGTEEEQEELYSERAKLNGKLRKLRNDAVNMDKLNPSDQAKLKDRLKDLHLWDGKDDTLQSALQSYRNHYIQQFEDKKIDHNIDSYKSGDDKATILEALVNFLNDNNITADNIVKNKDLVEKYLSDNKLGISAYIPTIYKVAKDDYGTIGRIIFYRSKNEWGFNTSSIVIESNKINESFDLDLIEKNIKGKRLSDAARYLGALVNGDRNSFEIQGSELVSKLNTKDKVRCVIEGNDIIKSIVKDFTHLTDKTESLNKTCKNESYYIKLFNKDNTDIDTIEANTEQEAIKTAEEKMKEGWRAVVYNADNKEALYDYDPFEELEESKDISNDRLQELLNYAIEWISGHIDPDDMQDMLDDLSINGNQFEDPSTIDQSKLNSVLTKALEWITYHTVDEKDTYKNQLGLKKKELDYFGIDLEESLNTKNELVNVGDKFINENGAMITILEPTRDNKVQFKITNTKTGKEGTDVFVTSSIKDILKDNGYTKVEEDKLKENNTNLEYKYMLLDRLKQDCKYFLGNGNGNAEHSLWAKDIDEQIEKMKEIYNSFSEEEKPDWITLEDIDNFEKRMKEYNKDVKTEDFSDKDKFLAHILNGVVKDIQSRFDVEAVAEFTKDEDEIVIYIRGNTLDLIDATSYLAKTIRRDDVDFEFDENISDNTIKCYIAPKNLDKSKVEESVVSNYTLSEIKKVVDSIGDDFNLKISNADIDVETKTLSIDREDLISIYNTLGGNKDELTESRPDKDLARAKKFGDSRAKLNLPDKFTSIDEIVSYLEKCDDKTDIMNVNTKVAGFNRQLHNDMLDFADKFIKENGHIDSYIDKDDKIQPGKFKEFKQAMIDFVKNYNLKTESVKRLNEAIEDGNSYFKLKLDTANIAEEGDPNYINKVKELLQQIISNLQYTQDVVIKDIGIYGFGFEGVIDAFSEQLANKYVLDSDSYFEIELDTSNIDSENIESEVKEILIPVVNSLKYTQDVPILDKEGNVMGKYGFGFNNVVDALTESLKDNSTLNNENNSNLEYISKEEYDKLPKDHKGTVKELKNIRPDVYRLILRLGYTDDDVTVMELTENGTTLVPKRLQEDLNVRDIKKGIRKVLHQNNSNYTDDSIYDFIEALTGITNIDEIPEDLYKKVAAVADDILNTNYLKQPKLQEDQYENERRKGRPNVKKIAEDEYYDNQDYYDKNIHKYKDMDEFIYEEIADIVFEYNLKEKLAEEVCQLVYLMATKKI